MSKDKQVAEWVIATVLTFCVGIVGVLTHALTMHLAWEWLVIPIWEIAAVSYRQWVVIALVAMLPASRVYFEIAARVSGENATPEGMLGRSIASAFVLPALMIPTLFLWSLVL